MYPINTDCNSLLIILQFIFYPYLQVNHTITNFFWDQEMWRVCIEMKDHSHGLLTVMRILGFWFITPIYLGIWSWIMKGWCFLIELGGHNVP